MHASVINIMPTSLMTSLILIYLAFVMFCSMLQLFVCLLFLFRLVTVMSVSELKGIYRGVHSSGEMMHAALLKFFWGDRLKFCIM